MGSESPGYEESFLDESTFAGGFEYASLLLQTHWHDTPVLYIRAHNMDTVEDAKEQQYGTMALELAEKWSLSSVDIYSDSDLCTEKPEYRNAYTSFKEKLGRCDGIHPTALGYSYCHRPCAHPVRYWAGTINLFYFIRNEQFLIKQKSNASDRIDRKRFFYPIQGESGLFLPAILTEF